MTLNNSWDAIVDQRRRHVASLIVRQLTQREICEALEKMHIVNVDTGRAWTVGTINHDIKALREAWRAYALQDITTHQTQRLMELAEVKRRGWIENDMSVVLRALKQESEMLGLDAPMKVAPTDPQGLESYHDLSLDERAQRILEIIALAQSRQGGTGSVPPSLPPSSDA